MKRLQNLLAGLCAGLVITAVLLAGLELALKYVPAGQSYYVVTGGEVQRAIRLALYPPNQRQVWRPGRDTLDARTEGLETREYIIETDADGFITPGRIHADPDLTIAFLGGSTTENFLVPAEARFPHLAGRRIEACTGERVNTINAGRSGITSMHSLNIFLNVVLPEKPDIAVMMHNINDYAVLHHEGSYWNGHPERSLLTTFPATSGPPDSPPDNRFERLARDLLPRLSNFVDHRLRSIGASSGGTPHTEPWATPKPIDMEPITGAFARSLETFVQAARAWGVQPVLMTMPDRWPETRDGWPPGLDAFLQRKVFGVDDYPAFSAGFDAMNGVVRATAARLGVPVIDLAEAIPGSVDMMFDPVHFNEAGSRRAAEVISGVLMRTPELIGDNPNAECGSVE